MKPLSAAVLAGLLLTAPSLAKKPVEVGVAFDVMSVEERQYRRIPGSQRSLTFNAARVNHLYIQWFVTPTISIGPYFLLYSTWGGGFEGWGGRFGGSLAYYPLGHRGSKVYAEGKAYGVFYDGERGDTVLGIGLGQQVRRGKHFVWHTKVEYERWRDYGDELLSLSLALGWRK